MKLSSTCLVSLLAATLPLSLAAQVGAPSKKYQTPMSIEEQNQQKVLSEAETKKFRRSYEGFNKLNTWSVSVHGGLSKFFGDLQTGDFLTNGPGEKTSFLAGLSVNKQLSHLFGLSANFGFGTLSGSKDKFVYIDPLNVSKGLSYGPNYFHSDILQGSLNFEANLKSLLFGTRKLRRLKADVFVGIGYLYYNTKVYAIRDYQFTDAGGNVRSYQKDEKIRFSNGPKSSTTAGGWEGAGSTYSRDLVIPTGIRFLYELSPRIDIGMRYTLNHTFTEKLDMTLGGYDNSNMSQIYSSTGGNNSFRRGDSAYDKYGTLGLEVNYKLGRKAARGTINGKYPRDNGQVYHLRWTDPKDLIEAPYNPTADTALARVKAIMPPPVDPRLYTDTDGDGVADLYDKEPNTPANSIVSGAGVAMNLKDLLQPMIDRKVPKETCTQVFGNVEFKTDQAVILPAAKNMLNDLISYLNEAKECRLVVVGHTDRRASDNYNLRLSRRRTEAVKKYVANSGLKDPSRVTIEYYGELRPIAPNDKPNAGMARNRRVELRILPMNNWKNYPGN